MRKIIIIGMDNPQGNDPLSTVPVGGTGHRLWQLAAARTGITEEEWLLRIDRRNLCAGKWSPAEAQIAADAMRSELEGQVVIALGMEVSACLGLSGAVLTWHPTESWVRIPHPSGLNRWYNDPAHEAAVQILLEDILHMASERKAA